MRASSRQGAIQTIPCRRQLCTLDVSRGGGTNWLFPGVQRFLTVFAMGNVSVLLFSCCGTQQLEHRRCLLSKSRTHCPGLCVRLSLLISSSNKVHWEFMTGSYGRRALATSMHLLCSASIPPSRAVRAGIALRCLCRYRTEAGMPDRNFCHLEHPLEMSLSLNSLGGRWHS